MPLFLVLIMHQVNHMFGENALYLMKVLKFYIRKPMFNAYYWIPGIRELTE